MEREICGGRRGWNDRKGKQESEKSHERVMEVIGAAIRVVGWVLRRQKEAAFNMPEGEGVDVDVDLDGMRIEA
jgi:hypothetical protein